MGMETLSRYLTLISYFQSVTVRIAEKEVSHSNMISLEPISSPDFPECANIATIQPLSIKPSKYLIWITARDKRIVLEFFFIQYIQIQEQHYDAYDEQGNVFNTLEGFTFEWIIESGNDIVKIVSQKEAGHTLTQIKKQMEFSKLHSDVLFLKGLKTGTAVVSVKIQEPGYDYVQQTSVSLAVTEPIVIVPSNTVYLLPTSEFRFKLAKVKLINGEMQYNYISLPSSQYEWNVDAEDKGMIGEDGVFISKKSEGLVNIYIPIFPNNTAESSVKVVFPSLVDIEITDVTEELSQTKKMLNDDFRVPFHEQLRVKEWDNNWYLIENHYYYVKVTLYDREKHLIQLTDNVVFNINVAGENEEYFEVVKKNTLSSELVVRAKKASEVHKKLVLVAYLEKIKSKYEDNLFIVDQNRLRSEKELSITKQVKIKHPTPYILLPLLKHQDESKEGEIWHMKAEGGSGHYNWHTQNPSIASVSGPGILKSISLGITKVFARDTHNTKNYDSIDVEVQPVFTLQWLEDHIEIARNDGIATLNVIALDKLGRKFTNCTAVQPSLEVKGEGIVTPVITFQSYNQMRQYVENNKELMFLKQQFDEEPLAQTIHDLKQRKKLNEIEQEVLLHNNFGICKQYEVQAIGVGLARANAFFTSQESLTNVKHIESNYVEIASYDDLITLKPTYQDFFLDLVSSQQKVSPNQETEFHKMFKEGVFDLSFGSSLKWIVIGGTNFWKDIEGMYQVSSKQLILNPEEGGLDPEILIFSKGEEITTHFTYQITCANPTDRNQYSKPHRFRVILHQWNQQSRHLLRPANHTISIEVHCEPPISQKIFWAQENNELSPNKMRRLPQQKAVTGEKVHYVLVNSNHYIRSMFFDSTNSVFYNYSSIHNSIQSSNDQMVKIYPFRDTYALEVADNVYDKRRLEFMNITGSVYISAIALHYHKAFFPNKNSQYFVFSSTSSLDFEPLHLNHQANDTIRVEIVRNVDIQPKYKAIYLASAQQEFVFRIYHGSGHYAVSVNNSKICEFQERDGNVTVIPKGEGGLEIIVEDLEIPDSQVTVAELLISDIARLDLDSEGTLIEQGSSMNMLITAFDIYGAEFDEDQYRLMRFDMEAESSQGMKRERGLVAEQRDRDPRKWRLTGKEPGIYQVTAYAMKFKGLQTDARKARVTSDMTKIEVFPLLEIHPNTLLLTPSMRYTLQIQGGPSRGAVSSNFQGSSVEIKFDVEDKNVAAVDVFREVTGLQVGDTKLFYEVIQMQNGKNGVQKRSIVSSKTIPIRVRLVTSIEIPYNNQRIVLQGSMIKLICVLKYNQETFTHGLTPVSYSWNSSNPAVFSLQYPTKGESTSMLMGNSIVNAQKKIRDNLNRNDVVFFSQFNASTTYAVANRQGESVIMINVAVEYPSIYMKEQNYFQTQILVKVTEKLAIEVPEFIQNPEKQTHLYLMPPNCYSKIETNKKTRIKLGVSQQSYYEHMTDSMQFKDSPQPIVDILNNEGIKTTDKYGKVTVIIEEDQAFSDQLVMLNIFITDIYSITSKDVYQALTFPLGSSMTIPIKFQNDRAHLFANNIEGIGVGVELSHPRVVNAEMDKWNQSLVLTAYGSGDCIVKVYLTKSPHIYDIFRIRVTSVVKPPSPVNLHLGGQVTFKLMEASEYVPKEGAIWSSSSSNVLDINSLTGEARGLSEGRVEILLSNHINAASIVQVSKVKHAEIDEKSRKNLVINTDENRRDIRIRIKMFLQDSVEELTPSVQYEGLTLIKQNVGLQCTPEHPHILEARAEISELEGFFCVLTFTGARSQNIPASSRVTVTVFASLGERDRVENVLYKEDVLSFDVMMLSNIKVESRYRNGVSLNRDFRTADIRIVSNVQFNVQAINLKEEDQHLDLIKFRVNKSSDHPNEYFLTVTVPREITHDFQTQLKLTHPLTQYQTILPVTFSGIESGLPYEGSYSRQREDYYEEEEEEGILKSLINAFTDKKEQKEQEEKEKQFKESGYKSRLQEPTPFSTYFLAFVLTVCTILFVLINILKIDPSDFFKDLIQLRWPFTSRQQASRRPQDYRPMRQDVREPLARTLFGTLNTSNQQQQNGKLGQQQQFQTPHQQQYPGLINRGSVRAPGAGQGFNLNQQQFSVDSQRSDQLNRSSIYNQSPPGRYRNIYGNS